jgi:hypothetical protein
MTPCILVDISNIWENHAVSIFRIEYTSILWIDVAGSSEMLVNIYKIRRHHVQRTVISIDYCTSQSTSYLVQATLQKKILFNNVRISQRSINTGRLL